MANRDEIKSFIKSNAMQLLSLIMLALATYITVRLAPISQDLASLKQKVDAIEYINNNRVSKDEFEVVMNEFRGRLDRVQASLNTIYEFHLNK